MTKNAIIVSSLEGYLGGREEGRDSKVNDTGMLFA
jgi:hypothetical protein